MDKKLEQRGKKFVRRAAGETWEDPTLSEWDAADYRIFCGDLGNEVTDDILARGQGHLSVRGSINELPSYVSLQ